MKKHLGKILTCIGAVLALVAFFMMFAPAATQEVLGKTNSLSGVDVTFGYEEKGVEVLGFSTNVTTYVLLLAGIACAVLAFFGKGGKICPIVAAVCFLVAGVFFFLSIQFAEFYPEMESGSVKDKLVETLKDNLNLGAGSIVGGIFSFLAAIAVAVPLFIKK